MRLRFRFRLRDVLLATTLVAPVLVVGICVHWRYFTPYGAYQVRKEGSALLGILAEEIKNGDSREYVVSKLGLGTVIDDEKPLESIRENNQQQPAAHADGFQKTDVFVMYSAAEGFGLQLQFRDDKLVNFNLPLPARQAMRQHYERYAPAEE